MTHSGSGSSAARSSGRAPNELRPVTIQRGYSRHAEGSVLVEFGHTRVLCTASVEERVPPHKRGSGEGWVTAEYGMLPRSTHTRSDREAARGKQSGRTQEIQRLIGRSLRAVFDLSALGERTITLDCDVLQADGGTRTAAITGAFVAAHDAVSTLLASGKLAASPIRDHVAAVSVGIVDGVDFQHSGLVRKVDVAGISQILHDGSLVLLSPLGFSPTGEAFNLTMEEVATSVAMALQADKLLFVTETPGIRQRPLEPATDENPIDTELSLADAKRLLAELRDLREGKEMIEERARREVGMVKSNEIFVQLTR